MTTREVVEDYFAAWTGHDVARARALLADDLTFIGPTARYGSAAEFEPALARFAAITRSATITELLVDGERAAMFYDCELGPLGKVRIASLFRVENGKIRFYETLFDATEFRKLSAAPR